MLEMKKLKYLAILLMPFTVAISFTNEGWLHYLPLVVFFGFIPLLELLFPSNDKNFNEKENLVAKEDSFYNILLYLMVPLQVAYLIWFLNLESTGTSGYFGRSLSMGIMCGVVGINVGHELGHRLNRFEQFLGEILLLTSLENHFLTYHNRGHHTNVGTPLDPATARKNEPLYFFWIRSHFGSYIQAWKIEIQRVRIMNKAVFSFTNKMISYSVAQLLLCGSIYYFLGSNVLIQFILVAVIGILLLETVNYIEHYGLIRKQRENGKYESVKRSHSWNANNIFGRVVLFELTRHSDHHFKADRPYQLLESHEESPIMPTGYPGMMLLSFIPLLFFYVMNKRI